MTKIDALKQQIKDFATWSRGIEISEVQERLPKNSFCYTFVCIVFSECSIIESHCRDIDACHSGWSMGAQWGQCSALCQRLFLQQSLKMYGTCTRVIIHMYNNITLKTTVLMQVQISQHVNSLMNKIYYRTINVPMCLYNTFKQTCNKIFLLFIFVQLYFLYPVPVIFLY